MSDEATVTVTVPAVEDPPAAGDPATALAAGAAAANAQHAQATADEALATAEAALAVAQAPSPGLSADEIRAIVRAELESAATMAQTSEPEVPEVEEVDVDPSEDLPSSEAPPNAGALDKPRGHPLMRAFLGRRD
jgi:hypothetical protein